MSARQSAEVTRALRLVARGSTPYAAARKVGIALSTIYRAQARQRAVARLIAAAPELLAAIIKAKAAAQPKGKA